MAQVRRGFPSKRRHVGIQAEPEMPLLNRAQQISLERFSLGWPWHEAKNAAALACELIRWAMPKPVWVDSDDPRVAVLEAQLGAEAPTGGDPYRTSQSQRVCVDPPEVSDARFEIVNICTLLGAYVNGEPVIVPSGFESSNDDPKTRLYWYATEVGKRATALADQAARVVTASQPIEDRDRWHAAGRAAQEACEFLRKHATNNPTVGMIDGAGGGVLHRISLALAYAGKPTEEITGRMFHWRVKDALKGRELSPELDANLRPAFEAAWSAGEYEFAYSLLEDLDQLAELP